MRSQTFVLWICVLFCSCVIEFTDSACPPHGYYNIPSFGDNCSYQCHCLNGAQCNTISGECPAGCARGWMGPGCQYRNISPKNSKIENHPGTDIPSDYAPLAVDGDLSTCSRTGTNHDVADNGRHYWRIQFDRDFYIAGLMLYIENEDRELFRGFRVETGSSSTSFQTLCYEHPNSPGEKVMEVMCTSPVVTRHLRVIFRDQFQRISLCEVDIYGGRQVSFNGVTEQSSTYVETNGEAFNSSKAVDGRPMFVGQNDSDAYKTCSATNVNNNQKNWWRLQLPSTMRIEEIYVYSRVANLDQTAGFALTISHPDGTSPLKHTDKKENNVSYYLPREIGIVQPLEGNHLEISLIRILVLCEVEVFAECLPGRCGWDCSDVCQCSDVTTGTYRMKGECPYGCEDRWTGPNQRCDHECTETQWGPYCNNTCGHCHDNQPCNVGNGHCPGGCVESWKPPLCAEKCDDGTYGLNCSSTCGNCTGYGPCAKVTGSCDQGCEPGLQLPYCKQPCPAGTYGQNCTLSCGNCAGVVPCHHVTGACPAGCADIGYKPPYCQTKCDDGIFGQDCSSTCGNCTEYGPCDKVTGTCDLGCEPGLQLPDCKQPCQVGTYGKNCSLTCKSCAGGVTCHYVTGICPGECADTGYKPPECKSECDDGTFGQNCSSTCGYCTRYEPCDKVTGTCHQGCEAGLQLPDCKQACKLGSYGRNCSLTCGNCAGEVYCNHVTGACPGGCSDVDYTPPNCDTMQQESVDQSFNVGAVLGGVVGGLVVICCVAAVGVFFLIRRRRQPKKEEQMSQNRHSVNDESGTYFDMLAVNREPGNNSVYDNLESECYNTVQSK